MAISLHGTTDEIRDKLVPINKKWNIQELITTLKNYPNLSNSERITFEYVMLRDVNDSLDDAKRLVKLIKIYLPKLILFLLIHGLVQNTKLLNLQLLKFLLILLKKLVTLHQLEDQEER